MYTESTAFLVRVGAGMVVGSVVGIMAFVVTALT